MTSLGPSDVFWADDEPARLPQILTAYVVTMGAFCIGTILGYSSPAGADLMPHYTNSVPRNDTPISRLHSLDTDEEPMQPMFSEPNLEEKIRPNQLNLSSFEYDAIGNNHSRLILIQKGDGYHSNSFESSAFIEQHSSSKSPHTQSTPEQGQNLLDQLISTFTDYKDLNSKKSNVSDDMSGLFRDTVCVFVSGKALTYMEVSWFASQVPLGALVGVVVGSVTLRVLGRRGTVLSSIAPLIIGWSFIGE